MADASIVPAAPPAKNCGLCGYAVVSPHGEPDTIECRRYAPHPSFYIRKSGEQDNSQLSPMWPIMDASSWCGEYTAK